ncbi:hypothetical protein HK104_001456, partial [Borealophlyctis nickersoniae]
DGEVLIVLLDQLYPDMGARKILEEVDLSKRATMIVTHCHKLGFTRYITPTSIASGNPKLNFAFLANLFSERPQLPTLTKKESRHLDRALSASLLDLGRAAGGGSGAKGKKSPLGVEETGQRDDGKGEDSVEVPVDMDAAVTGQESGGSGRRKSYAEAAASTVAPDTTPTTNETNSGVINGAQSPQPTSASATPASSAAASTLTNRRSSKPHLSVSTASVAAPSTNTTSTTNSPLPDSALDLSHQPPPIILGCNPTSLVAALALAKHVSKVVIISPDADPRTQSAPSGQTITISRRGVEALEALGVASNQVLAASGAKEVESVRVDSGVNNMAINVPLGGKVWVCKYDKFLCALLDHVGSVAGKDKLTIKFGCAVTDVDASVAVVKTVSSGKQDMFVGDVIVETRAGEAGVIRIGEALHTCSTTIVGPFGISMDAALEDCLVLSEAVEKCGGSVKRGCAVWKEKRKTEFTAVNDISAHFTPTFAPLKIYRFLKVHSSFHLPYLSVLTFY